MGILAITYGDILTLDGIKQILETFKKCGWRYMLELEMEIVSNACKLNDILRKLFMDLWRSNQYIPSWMYSSSVWALKENNGLDTWKVRISLLHLDDTVPIEKRYDQLVSTAQKLVDFSNSKQYKDELLKVTPDIQSIYVQISPDISINSSYQLDFSIVVITAVFMILLF